MNDTELSRLLEPLVRREFAGHGLDRVEIRSASDHDGDPIVDVRITLTATNERLDPKITFRLARELLSALSQSGDQRFPVVRVFYPSDQSEENFYPDVKPRRKAAGR